MTDISTPIGARPFQHHGRTRDAVSLALVNLLLNIVTLSWWRFWGHTRVRRFLWSNTTLWGDPLEYTGTGRELFLGFLVVVFAIFMPLMLVLGALQNLMLAGEDWAAIPVFAINIFIVFLAGAGIYRAYRYRLTRTQWRGIRAGLDGAAWQYGLMFIGTGMLTVLTLGWALPWASVKLLRYQLGNVRLGDLRFECDARSRPLYGRFALIWVGGAFVLMAILMVGAIAQKAGEHLNPSQVELLGALFAIIIIPVILVVLGVTYAWYLAGFLREIAAKTRFDGQPFEMNVRIWPLIRLALGNMLIATLSLGILTPWVALRTLRYSCANLDMDGQPDFSRVNQSTQTAPRLGEGLAAVFDGAGTF